ncbi:MAG: cupin [Chloroflexota bacterium]
MTQDALVARLRAEGLDAGAWSNGPHDVYAPHEHGFDKVLVCAAGSIRFGLPATGGHVDLAEGDRLDLPAGTRHEAFVGPRGVSCLEAHLPAGALAGLRHRPAGGW